MDVELKVPSAEYLKRSCAPSQSNLDQTRIQMRVLRAGKSKKGTDSRIDTESAACEELGASGSDYVMRGGLNEAMRAAAGCLQTAYAGTK